MVGLVLVGVAGLCTILASLLWADVLDRRSRRLRLGTGPLGAPALGGLLAGVGYALAFGRDRLGDAGALGAGLGGGLVLAVVAVAATRAVVRHDPGPPTASPPSQPPP